MRTDVLQWQQAAHRRRGTRPRDRHPSDSFPEVERIGSYMGSTAVDAGLGSAQELPARPRTVTPGSTRGSNRKRMIVRRVFLMPPSIQGAATPKSPPTPERRTSVSSRSAPRSGCPWISTCGSALAPDQGAAIPKPPRTPTLCRQRTSSCSVPEGLRPVSP